MNSLIIKTRNSEMSYEEYKKKFICKGRGEPIPGYDEFPINGLQNFKAKHLPRFLWSLFPIKTFTHKYEDF